MDKKVLHFGSLQKILTDYNKRVRSKSDQAPTALYATKLYDCSLSDDALRSVYSSLLNNKAVPLVVKAVASLQMTYGLRITEVLKIGVGDISKNGHIRIKGLKGSSDRIVYPVFYNEFWNQSNSSILPLITVYSRHFFYRWYKRFGLSISLGRNKKNAVTHCFRHLVVNEISGSFDKSELTQRFIGHKNLKSTKHYERKKK